MVEIQTKRGISSVLFSDQSVQLPHQPNDYLKASGILVVVLGSWHEANTDLWDRLARSTGTKKHDENVDAEPDFEIENPYQNVIAFGADGELLWKIPEVPHPGHEDDEPYYLSLWTTDGDLWVRNKNQRSYRVDPADGTLLEDIPADQFRLGGRTIEFDRGWVDQVIHHDDLVIVRLDGSGHPGPAGKNIYVFNQDGTRRWWIAERLNEDPETPAPPFTNIWMEEEVLAGYSVDGYKYFFDPDDGTLLGQKWVK